jgi:AcrR family transcriptional regulator
MPELMDHGYRVDELVRATIHLMNTEGIESFTIRKLAAVARVSPSSVISHLENKARVTDLVTKLVSRQLEDELTSGVRRRGVLAFVPDDTAAPEDPVLPLVRTWLAMCELARGNDDLAACVAYLEDQQRYLFEWGCRLGPEDAVTVDAVRALVTGLWTAMCARSEPMSAARATAALRRACEALGVPVVPEDS